MFLQEVSQLEMEMHLEAFHGVETDAIDWSKPIATQVCSSVQQGRSNGAGKNALCLANRSVRDMKLRDAIFC